jgi:lysophospholipase L1-like esterase
MRNAPRRFVLAVLAVSVALGLSAVAEQTTDAQWVTAWGTSQQGLGDTSLTDATVRLMARVTATGKSIRIRLDNSYGTRPLVVGAAAVGEPMRGATLAPGSSRAVLFDGATRVTIPAGGSVQSDAVVMPVLAQQDLAVSLHLPETDVQPSQHNGAKATSFFTTNGGGDHTTDEAADAFTETTTAMFWLKSIDVLSSMSTGAIVAFGDSITDGSCATDDGHDRWLDWVTVRLQLQAMNARHKAVVNEGIGGNTVTGEVTPAPSSTPGRERLERDVLTHSGVTHVILFMGTNDIRREADAAQVTAGMQEIIDRVHAGGMKIMGATIIPRHDRAPTENNTGWSPAKTAIRHEVNEWIRNEAAFDGVLDFDLAVQDAADANLIESNFNCDGIHPNPRGYYEMGSGVNLDLFKDE